MLYNPADVRWDVLNDSHNIIYTTKVYLDWRGSLSSSGFTLDTTWSNDRILFWEDPNEGWSVKEAITVGLLGSDEGRRRRDSNEEQGVGRLVRAWPVGSRTEMVSFWTAKGGAGFRSNEGVGRLLAFWLLEEALPGLGGMVGESGKMKVQLKMNLYT